MKIKKAFDICKKNKIISIFGNEKRRAMAVRRLCSLSYFRLAGTQ